MTQSALDPGQIAMAIHDVLGRIGHPRLLVFGDLILDRYTWGSANRVSPEAPVLVLQADAYELRPGGAASVAALLHGLGAEVVPAGVIGDDTAGRQLFRLLAESGIATAMIVCDSERSTTAKERFMGRAAGRHPHQILRVDSESTSSVGRHLEDELLKRVLSQLPQCDALLVSDYAKGVCTPRILAELRDAASGLSIPVVVDPARIDDYSRYAGVDVITPNRTEAEIVGGIPIHSPEDAAVVARKLRDRFGVRAVVVTLDCDGMVCAAGADGSEHFPTKARSVYDITGAGDMILAVIGLAGAAGVSLVDAIQLANVAAGIEVERLGVGIVTRAEIQAELATIVTAHVDKLITVDQMAALADSYREQGKSVVLTNGCFDLLHVGHVRCLQDAARLGDVLIAAVNCDAVVATLKGPGRPIISEQDRAAMLAALTCVDHVVIFKDETPHRLLRQLRPDVLVKGGTTEILVGEEIVAAYGGRVVRTAATPAVSTTAIFRSIQAGSYGPVKLDIN